MSAHFVSLLEELRRRSLRVASQVEDMVQESSEVVFAAHQTLAQRIIARDEEVDAEEVGVEAEVIRLLALYQPVGRDLRLLTAILKITNDLERVADCAVNIAERARHLQVQNLASRSPELERMFALTRQALHNAVQAFSAEDAQAARRVMDEDQAIDLLYAQLVQQVVTNSGGSGPMAAVFDLLSVAKNVERIADHASNLAEDVVFLVTGTIVRHFHGAVGA